MWETQPIATEITKREGGLLNINDHQPGFASERAILKSSGATHLAADPLLTVREGASTLGISVPTFWRRVADGTVPKPIKLGSLSRWPRSEILQVIEDAKAARDDAA